MNQREHNRPHQGQGGSRYGGRGQQDEPDPTVTKFKQLIQTKSFKDDEIMQLSEALGKSLASTRRRGEGEGKEATRTQVRKFYNLVRVAQTSASAQGVLPGTVKVKLRSLQAQVAYAVARGTIGMPFKDFFDASLNKVIGSPNLKESLAEFAVFFEALYAYFYFHSEGRR
jgi:CRISPR type III-A-associated protein Csm2